MVEEPGGGFALHNIIHTYGVDDCLSPSQPCSSSGAVVSISLIVRSPAPTKVLKSQVWKAVSSSDKAYVSDKVCTASCIERGDSRGESESSDTLHTATQRLSAWISFLLETTLLKLPNASRRPRSKVILLSIPSRSRSMC